MSFSGSPHKLWLEILPRISEIFATACFGYVFATTHRFCLTHNMNEKCAKIKTNVACLKFSVRYHASSGFIICTL